MERGSLTSMATMKAEETKEEGSSQFWKKLSSTAMMEEEDDGGLDLCPSFNSYSVDRLADTAARVTKEFEGMGGDGHGGDEDEFEFFSFQKTEEQMVVEDFPIFPVFPIFNHDLLLEKRNGAEANDFRRGNAPSIRISLEKLLSDDRDRDRDSPSSSSSEADDLDGIPAGTYCVWTPKPVQTAEHGKCKKSKSTGSGSSSSRRWRLRNLLPRSNSEGGRNLFIFLTPSSRSESTRKKEEKTEKLGEEAKGKKSCSVTNVVTVKSKLRGGSIEKASSAHELFYVRNKMLREGDKRRSYLPYRQDLVGFWTNMNTISKAFPPF